MMPSVVLLADYAGTVNLSDRIEVRGRHADNANPDPSLDLIDVPRARIDLRDHLWDYSLGYSAIIVFANAQEVGAKQPAADANQPTGATPAGLSTQVLQSGDVSATWHDRRARLGVAEYGTYGYQNSALLLGAPVSTTGTPTPSSTPTPTPLPVATGGTGVQALAQASTIEFGASRTALTAQLQFSRQWAGTSQIEYGLQGGMNAAARAVLPLIKGPRAEASTSVTVTRLDILETRLSAFATEASETPCPASASSDVVIPANGVCTPAVQSGQLTETWRHRITPRSQISVGAGVSSVRLRLGAESAFASRVYPVAVAGFQHERELNDVRTVIRLDAQVAPVLDFRTGLADQRAQATGSLTLPMKLVTASGTLGATHTLASDAGQKLTSLQVSGELDYRVERFMTFGGGVRYVWQDQGPAGSFAGGLAFLQITFIAPAGRF
jgi:hypothetical protein